jgi:hypothetical protein
MSKNITEAELQILEACQRETDWSEACKRIKGFRDGVYPDDWWARVKLTGMMDRIMARWGKNSELKFSTHKNIDDMLEELGHDE